MLIHILQYRVLEQFFGAIFNCRHPRRVKMFSVIFFYVSPSVEGELVLWYRVVDLRKPVRLY